MRAAVHRYTPALVRRCRNPSAHVAVRRLPLAARSHAAYSLAMVHLSGRLAAYFLACAAALAHAQPPAPPQPITAVKLAPGERIRMDGTLADPAWQRAPVFKDFMVREPEYGHANEWETRVQV